MSECSVCLLAYTANQKAPTTLGCGHTFCMTCVNQLHKRDDVSTVYSTDNPDFPAFIRLIDTRWMIQCPTCRLVSGYPDETAHPKNYAMIELLRESNSLAVT